MTLSVALRLRLSPEDYARLTAIAEAQERTVSQVVRSAIQAYVKEHP